MSPRQKILQFVERLHLKRNTSIRTDCPYCGGEHTFSVSNICGKLKWYCFKASCNIKGIENKELTMDDIKAMVLPKETLPLYIKDCVGWTQNIKAYPSVMEYLNKNNCIQAYEAYPNRIWYDRVRDRVVFVKYDTINSFKLATGRSLCGAAPKWYKYVALLSEYFTATFCVRGIVSKTTVIVEDAASACSASRLANSVALCGTSYSISGLVKELGDTLDVVVCLDPDAQLKALKLQRDLLGSGNFRSVKVVNPRDDLKYLDKNELFSTLYGENYESSKESSCEEAKGNVECTI